MIGAAGELLGIGSLQLEQGREKGASGHLNMIVPIDLLKPILDDLVHHGRPNRPPRPWLGLYAAEIEDRIVVIGLAERGPAQRAGLRTGDIVLSVAGAAIAKPCRHVPAHLVARQCRGRSPDQDRARRPRLRAEDRFRRPQQVFQSAKAALTRPALPNHALPCPRPRRQPQPRACMTLPTSVLPSDQMPRRASSAEIAGLASRGAGGLPFSTDGADCPSGGGQWGFARPPHQRGLEQHRRRERAGER